MIAKNYYVDVAGLIKPDGWFDFDENYYSVARFEFDEKLKEAKERMAFITLEQDEPVVIEGITIDRESPQLLLGHKLEGDTLVVALLVNDHLNSEKTQLANADLDRIAPVLHEALVKVFGEDKVSDGTEKAEDRRPTKGEQFNRFMQETYDFYNKNQKLYAKYLKEQGVPQEEITKLENNSGLHGNPLSKKVLELKGDLNFKNYKFKGGDKKPTKVGDMFFAEVTVPEVTKFLKESVEDLKFHNDVKDSFYFPLENADYNNSWAIVLEWESGWGKEKRNEVIQNKYERDYAICVDIKKINHRNPTDSWDALPGFGSTGISPKENYEALANSLLDAFELFGHDNSIGDSKAQDSGNITLFRDNGGEANISEINTTIGKRWLAVAQSKSKEFRTQKGAVDWLGALGYKLKENKAQDSGNAVIDKLVELTGKTSWAKRKSKLKGSGEPVEVHTFNENPLTAAIVDLKDKVLKISYNGKVISGSELLKIKKAKDSVLDTPMAHNVFFIQPMRDRNLSHNDIIAERTQAVESVHGKGVLFKDLNITTPAQDESRYDMIKWCIDKLGEANELIAIVPKELVPSGGKPTLDELVDIYEEHGYTGCVIELLTYLDYVDNSVKYAVVVVDSKPTPPSEHEKIVEVLNEAARLNDAKTVKEIVSDNVEFLFNDKVKLVKRFGNSGFRDACDLGHAVYGTKYDPSDKYVVIDKEHPFGEAIYSTNDDRIYETIMEQVHGEDWNKGQDGKDFYYLQPKFETVKSYNNKAVVVVSPNGATLTLLSYGEPVVRINVDRDEVTLLPKWNESATTLRHVKEFLNQEGFRAGTKMQIASDYEQVAEDSKPIKPTEYDDATKEWIEVTKKINTSAFKGDPKELAKLVARQKELDRKRAKAKDAKITPTNKQPEFGRSDGKLYRKIDLYVDGEYIGSTNGQPSIKAAIENLKSKKSFVVAGIPNKLVELDGSEKITGKFGDSKAGDANWDVMLANLGFDHYKGHGEIQKWKYRGTEYSKFEKAIENIRDKDPKLILSSTPESSGEMIITIQVPGFTKGKDGCGRHKVKDSEPWDETKNEKYQLIRKGNKFILSKIEGMWANEIMTYNFKGNAEPFINELNRRGLKVDKSILSKEPGFKKEWLVKIADNKAKAKDNGEETREELLKQAKEIWDKGRKIIGSYFQGGTPANGYNAWLNKYKGSQKFGIGWVTNLEVKKDKEIAKQLADKIETEFADLKPVVKYFDEGDYNKGDYQINLVVYYDESIGDNKAQDGCGKKAKDTIVKLDEQAKKVLPDLIYKYRWNSDVFVSKGDWKVYDGYPGNEFEITYNDEIVFTKKYSAGKNDNGFRIESEYFENPNEILKLIEDVYYGRIGDAKPKAQDGTNWVEVLGLDDLSDGQEQMLDNNIKDWYKKAYKDDDLGEELDDNSTFSDAVDALLNGNDIYGVLGEYIDTVIRERVFEELANILEVEYDNIYDMWLDV